jgi:hypothetical protein
MRHVQCLFGLKRLIQIVGLASQGAEGASIHTLRCHRLSTGSVAPVIEAALQWRNPSQAIPCPQAHVGSRMLSGLIAMVMDALLFGAFRVSVA